MLMMAAARRPSKRFVAAAFATASVTLLSGCGVQLNAGEHGACAPGIDEWFEQIADEAVMRVPAEATGVARLGTNDCPRLPIVGVFAGTSVVQLSTRYSTTEAEEQGAVRLQNAAGLADWQSFEGGGECQVKVIDSVPSFLTLSSGEDAFMVTIRRGDPSLCRAANQSTQGESEATTELE